MRDKKIKLLCIISIGENLDRLKFKANKEYIVAINHPHIVYLVGEDGYKMGFSRREEDMNLPYLWNYFYEEDKELLDSHIEKLY